MIVLDTHTLIWWVNADKKLSAKAKSAIRKEQSSNGDILLSAITAWEIAMLVDKGRLTLSMDVDDWLATTGEIETVRFVSIEPEIAVQSVRLPGEFHPDPADRLITALARHFSSPLVTADEKIIAYKHVKTIDSLFHNAAHRT